MSAFSKSARTTSILSAEHAEQQARVFDEAFARALALREEAIQAFWSGTDAWISQQAGTASRAARRFASRLARHKALRGAQPSQAGEDRNVSIPA